MRLSRNIVRGGQGQGERKTERYCEKSYLWIAKYKKYKLEKEKGKSTKRHKLAFYTNRIFTPSRTLTVNHN